MSNLVIIDQETGEKLPLLADKKILTEYLLSMPDSEKGSVLTKVNFLKKIMATMEGIIKNYVKGIAEFDDNVYFFQNWKVTDSAQRRFSEKKLLSSNNKDDIETWTKLKEKYMDSIQVIRFQ